MTARFSPVLAALLVSVSWSTSVWAQDGTQTATPPPDKSEQILEAYYALGFARGLTLSFTYQNIRNPGYNRDRGPINILGLRLHGEF